MSRNEFHADNEFRIKVERENDEYGAITLTITANGDIITINAGRFQDDADQLRGELEGATDQARDIHDEWEDRPDEEDGCVFFDRGGYYAKLSSTQAGPFPSRDIATYELARLEADAGFFPNAWYQDERGGMDAIHEQVRAFHDEGGDKLLPLSGVRFAESDEVTVNGQDDVYEVVTDYGDLGVVVSRHGETEVHEPASLTPYTDDDDEDQAEEYDHSRAKEDTRNAWQHES